MLNLEQEADKREHGDTVLRLKPSMSSQSMMLPVAAVICALMFVLMASSVHGGVRDTAGYCKDLTIVDFSKAGNVGAGEPFRRLIEDRGWNSPLGDPEYEAFLRYIAIGWGASSRRGLQRFCRKVGEDFFEAFSQKGSVSDSIELFLMIDSNTLAAPPSRRSAGYGSSATVRDTQVPFYCTAIFLP